MGMAHTFLTSLAHRPGKTQRLSSGRLSVILAAAQVIPPGTNKSRANLRPSQDETFCSDPDRDRGHFPG